MFLEEYKYVGKEKKTSNFITCNIEISSNGSYNKDYNEKSSDEENKIYYFFRFETRKFRFSKYKKFLFFRLYKFPVEI